MSLGVPCQKDQDGNQQLPNFSCYRYTQEVKLIQARLDPGSQVRSSGFDLSSLSCGFNFQQLSEKLPVGKNQWTPELNRSVSQFYQLRLRPALQTQQLK